MSQVYAGIGSRRTPPEVLARMEALGEALAAAGWTLRSGAALGADSAFERGCDRADGRKEIFLPYPSWRGRHWGEPGVPVISEMTLERCRAIAAKFHPCWAHLSPWAQAFHARNALQVLGPALCEPARLVLCWTPGATGEGGTGQAIRHARSLGIPVFDLADAEFTEWTAMEFLAHARKPGSGVA